MVARLTVGWGLRAVAVPVAAVGGVGVDGVGLGQREANPGRDVALDLQHLDREDLAPVVVEVQVLLAERHLDQRAVLRQSADVVDDQATDGLEVALGQVDAERTLHLVDVDVALHDPDAVVRDRHV